MTWKSMVLADICTHIFAGGDVPKNSLSKYQTEQYQIPIYANGEKNKGLYGFTDIARVTKPSMTVSARGTIGYSEIRYEPFFPIVRLIVLTPNEEIVQLEYLKYVLKSIDFKNSGTSIPQLTVPMIKKYECKVPSLETQKQIVAKLDQAFAEIEKAKVNAEQNLKNARELFQSLSLQAFSNHGNDWSIKPLGEVVVVERGSSPRPIKKYQTDNENGVNWIKIGDTKEGAKYVESTKEKITPEGAKKSRFVDIGDFILSNSMSFGRPYIMKIQGYIHDGWFVLRLPESIDTNYFYHLLSSPYLMEQFQSLASGSVVKNISGDLVKKAILPIPPFDEQKRIADELEQLSQQIAQLQNIYKRKLDSLNELKQFILQKAFKGELT